MARKECRRCGVEFETGTARKVCDNCETPRERRHREKMAVRAKSYKPDRKKAAENVRRSYARMNIRRKEELREYQRNWLNKRMGERARDDPDYRDKIILEEKMKDPLFRLMREREQERKRDARLRERRRYDPEHQEKMRRARAASRKRHAEMCDLEQIQKTKAAIRSVVEGQE